MISLGKDEEMVYEFKHHWACLIVPLILCFVWIGIPLLIYRMARLYFDEIAVTNQKFHARVGLITKDVLSTPLKNINNVTFQQGLFGRIFGYGTVNVHSAALGGVSSFAHIKNPELAKSSIEQAIANQVTKVTLA